MRHPNSELPFGVLASNRTAGGKRSGTDFKLSTIISCLISVHNLKFIIPIHFLKLNHSPIFSSSSSSANSCSSAWKSVESGKFSFFMTQIPSNSGDSSASLNREEDSAMWGDDVAISVD